MDCAGFRDFRGGTSLLVRLRSVRKRKPSTTDADLDGGAPVEPDVGAASRGDRKALSRLWTEHRVWVAAVVECARPRSVELEDLMQEVALRFVSRFASLREHTRLRPWLRSIARNVCTDAARRASLRQCEDRELDHLPLRPAAESMRVIEARDELARTRSALESLPENAREVLALRAIEGLSQRELAEILDLPETTIETRLARARRALRAALRTPTSTRKCLR